MKKGIEFRDSSVLKLHFIFLNFLKFLDKLEKAKPIFEISFSGKLEQAKGIFQN